MHVMQDSAAAAVAAAAAVLLLLCNLVPYACVEITLSNCVFISANVMWLDEQSNEANYEQLHHWKVEHMVHEW